MEATDKAAASQNTTHGKASPAWAGAGAQTFMWADAGTWVWAEAVAWVGTLTSTGAEAAAWACPQTGSYLTCHNPVPCALPDLLVVHKGSHLAVLSLPIITQCMMKGAA